MVLFKENGEVFSVQNRRSTVYQFIIRISLMALALLTAMTLTACPKPSPRGGTGGFRPGAGGGANLGAAPNFNLPGFYGKNYSLTQFKGKVVLVNFWATWCPPCRAEIPDLNSLYLEKKKELVVIGISLDDNQAVVKQFLQSNRIDYPVVFGNDKVANDYGGISGIPTTFIVDKKGVIRDKIVGGRDKSAFEEAVQPYI